MSGHCAARASWVACAKRIKLYMRTTGFSRRQFRSLADGSHEFHTRSGRRSNLASVVNCSRECTTALSATWFYDGQRSVAKTTDEHVTRDRVRCLPLSVLLCQNVYAGSDMLYSVSTPAVLCWTSVTSWPDWSRDELNSWSLTAPPPRSSLTILNAQLQTGCRPTIPRVRVRVSRLVVAMSRTIPCNDHEWRLQNGGPFGMSNPNRRQASIQPVDIGTRISTMCTVSS